MRASNDICNVNIGKTHVTSCMYDSSNSAILLSSTPRDSSSSRFDSNRLMKYRMKVWFIREREIQDVY